MLTLYDAARCPYCARVRIVLAEKDIGYKFTQDSIGQHKRHFVGEIFGQFPGRRAVDGRSYARRMFTHINQGIARSGMRCVHPFQSFRRE